MSAEDRQKWDARYAEMRNVPASPSPLLTQLDDVLPRSGAALDLAGGCGRHAVWLARRGLDVTLADISIVGLRQAKLRAAAAGVQIETLCIDFERELFPPGPWDLIVAFCFLQRELFDKFQHALLPGGRLVFAQPTKRNLERHSRPPERFLLDDGELPGLIQGLEIEQFQEGWLQDGQHTAFLVARRRN